MRKYQIKTWVFITSMILLTGLKNHRKDQNILSGNSPVIISHDDHFTESPKINIADVIAVKSDKGQKIVEVLVCLSKASSELVSVKYNTKDGSAKAGVDYIATSGSVAFESGEVAKRIKISIIGEVAADPDEDAPIQADIEFWVNLNNAIGGIIEKQTAIITLLRNLANDHLLSGNEPMYEVVISYKGYASLYGDAQDCPIRKDGWVILSGVLKGKGNVASYDDITYRGTLQMDIKIDVCSIHHHQNGESEYCSIKVEGSGKVDTELKIYYDTRTTGRGGYIQIENKDGRFIRTVTGTCETEQVDEEWTMIPNKSIASMFNGQELPMLTTRTLQVQRYPVHRDDQGNETEVWVVRKIQ